MAITAKILVYGLNFKNNGDMVNKVIKCWITWII